MSATNAILAFLKNVSVFFGLLWLSIMLAAQTYAIENFIQLNQASQRLNSTEYFYYQHDPLLADPSKTASFIIQSDNNAWLTPDSIPFNQIKSDHPIWFKSHLQTKQLSTPYWVFSYDVPITQYVDFYLVHKNKIISHYSAGASINPDQRIYYSRNHVFPIQLEENEMYDIYVRLHSNTQIIFSSTLATYIAVEEAEQSIIAFHIFYFGACLFLILYNFLLFISTREKSFFYYVLLISATALYGWTKAGYGQLYFWPTVASLNSSAIYLSASFIFLCSNIFTITFLDIKNNAPRMYRFFQFFVALNVFAFALALTQQFYWTTLLLSGSSIINHIGFIVAGVIVWRKGFKHAAFFVAAWIPITVLLVIRAVSLLGIIEVNETIMHLLKMCRLVEFVLLSAALSSQINLLRAQQERAIQENQAKNSFLSRMSFQIRTPMMGIIGLSNLLNNKLENETDLRYNQVIRNSGNSLITILNDIVDFSSIETDSLEIKHKEFSVAELFSEALDLFSKRAEDNGIKLTCHIDDSIPDIIISDPARLKQIIINLVGNALKFTHKGEITVQLEPIPTDIHALQLSVKDTGIGMNAETQEKLFESYSQAEKSTARLYGGTGLGLSICKQLAELMGGEIGVKSTEGVGSTFWISFQYQTRSEFQDALKKSSLHTQKKANSGIKEHAPLNILVAEDNAIAQRVLKEYLTTLGHQYKVVENGSKALLEVTTRPSAYDLILMDCKMPVADGWSTAAIIRRWQNSSHCSKRIPIIALTAYATALEVERCFAAGMDAYLAKPVDIEALERSIQKTLASAISQSPTVINF